MILQRLGRSKIGQKIFVRCGSSLFNILRYYKSRLANTRNCKRRQSQFPDKILFMSRYILKWPLHYLASIIIASSSLPLKVYQVCSLWAFAKYTKGNPPPLTLESTPSFEILRRAWLTLMKIIKNEASQETLPQSDRIGPTYRLLSPFLNRSTDGC